MVALSPGVIPTNDEGVEAHHGVPTEDEPGTVAAVGEGGPGAERVAHPREVVIHEGRPHTEPVEGRDGVPPAE
eukprot:909434-Prymnesium_polylepis.1